METVVIYRVRRDVALTPATISAANRDQQEMVELNRLSFNLAYIATSP